MTGNFTPSDLQATAIREIKDWFLHRTAEQQVFRVFGYAGVGKTSITRHAIDELGLDTMAKSADGVVSSSDGVLYAAFTGKAALVMTRKGTPASTIHSLIYRVSEATPDEIERVKQEIAEIRARLPTLDPAVRLFEESRLRSLEIRLDDTDPTTVTETSSAQVAAEAAPDEAAAPAPGSEAAPSPQPPPTTPRAGGTAQEARHHAAAIPASSAPEATAPPVVQQPTAQVIDLEGVRADERRATLAYVIEVHELCALAARGDLAAGFIARAAPVAQIRRTLLEARAAEDEATAIRSQVRPVVAEPAQPAIDTAAIYAARNHNAR